MVHKPVNIKFHFPRLWTERRSQTITFNTAAVHKAHNNTIWINHLWLFYTVWWPHRSNGTLKRSFVKRKNNHFECHLKGKDTSSLENMSGHYISHTHEICDDFIVFPVEVEGTIPSSNLGSIRSLNYWKSGNKVSFRARSIQKTDLELDKVSFLLSGFCSRVFIMGQDIWRQKFWRDFLVNHLILSTIKIENF